MYWTSSLKQLNCTQTAICSYTTAFGKLLACSTLFQPPKFGVTTYIWDTLGFPMPVCHGGSCWPNSHNWVENNYLFTIMTRRTCSVMISTQWQDKQQLNENLLGRRQFKHNLMATPRLHLQLSLPGKIKFDIRGHQAFWTWKLLFWYWMYNGKPVWYTLLK